MAAEESVKQTLVETEVQSLDLSDFSALLKKEFRPRTDRVQEEVEAAVRTLAEYVLQHANVVSTDAIRTIEAIRAALDRKLTEQLNQILHHPAFQELEGAWRGLHHLVNNTETDEMLKIRVMNISKKELGAHAPEV